ncbi:hypothetical protein LEP1GSC047_2607 [Leptospira inadai serovar Lyme str. 10]|uniref:Uncharacterized protein n=2 Tax=Leptospira inadai serovar Lyme TaxID=293084 RepID=V6HAY7_9LEPT|nr:hypothetical protein LEP1GSC047_2607 [Leptospira inadai serovar Lyme str. 10]PNV75767.1 hypothetical protein BES34_006975 [Leptospira inadai serovar Lyme]
MDSAHLQRNFPTPSSSEIEEGREKTLNLAKGVRNDGFYHSIPEVNSDSNESTAGRDEPILSDHFRIESEYERWEFRSLRLKGRSERILS